MFKRLSHAHSLTLAIWFLFRNVKTSTRLSYLQHHCFSFRLQICKTSRCDLRSRYLHSKGPGCCQQELKCGCYSGSSWSLMRDTTLIPHPILTTRSPAIPISSRLPPYHWKTDPPEALCMDHKTSPFLSEPYIEMLRCGANMGNASSIALQSRRPHPVYFFGDVNFWPYSTSRPQIHYKPLCPKKNAKWD